MKTGLLPKLLLSPSVILVAVCVYGYIMFTIYLSFTTSTMMPSYDLAGTASYSRLLGLENWQVSLANLGTFATLYIVVAGLLGLGFAILIDQKIRAESAFRSVVAVATGKTPTFVVNRDVLQHKDVRARLLDPHR